MPSATTERDDDEQIVTLLKLAGDGWGLGDMATAIEADVVRVIELLHEHRDAFGPAYQI